MPFTEETFKFLRQLKRNNRREWFQPRKLDYVRLVRKPMEDFVAELQQELAQEFSEIRFDPKKSIFRPYRDTRFSSDKTPYKTNVAASFDVKGPKVDYERPGFYISLAPGEVYAGAGLYMPNSAQLKLIRQTISKDAESLEKIIGEPGFKKRFKKIQGERLKKAPQGYTPDHPEIELLKQKQFYVLSEFEEAEVFNHKRFLKRVVEDFRLSGPFVRWLKRSTSELEFRLPRGVAS